MSRSSRRHSVPAKPFLSMKIVVLSAYSWAGGLGLRPSVSEALVQASPKLNRRHDKEKKAKNMKVLRLREEINVGINFRVLCSSNFGNYPKV